MYSARDNSKQQDIEDAIVEFTCRQPSSFLYHHARDCCLVAKEWFLAMDKELRRGDSETEAPGWIREHFRWGPSQWPLNWCEVVQRSVLDCGGLAILARESFTARGIVVLPAQVIRLHSQEDCEQWKIGWQNKGCPADWIHTPYVYHEAVAVVRGESVQLWDPSENSWIEPDLQPGYASTVAIRVIATASGSNRVLVWGKYRLLINSWKSATGCRI